MARVAVIGEASRVQGFALAGAVVHPVAGPDAVRAAWAGLADDIAVVLLTPAAADALDAVPPGDRLTVVMPR
jgi:vacuolar-type H+-ATPase subunit F/Vma7